VLLGFLLTISMLASGLPAATVDGIPIHFSSWGKGPRTVILVHGWTCDETSWTAQLPLAAEGYRVVALDLPGHGKSGAPRDGKFSMDLFARAVEAVRAEVRADRVVLAGHSMGTPVIVQYARLYPRHVAALVFVDGVVTLRREDRDHPPDLRQYAGPKGLKYRETMIRNGMFSASTTPALQTKILAMMLATPEATAMGAMEATFDPAIWKDDVLAMPILAIYADKSGFRHPAYMKEHFPSLEYVEIPATGHFLMLERPAEFNRLLSAFLNRQKF
jgi:pimeloyl-ACP methyl ester carboxylesterase